MIGWKHVTHNGLDYGLMCQQGRLSFCKSTRFITSVTSMDLVSPFELVAQTVRQLHYV